MIDRLPARLRTPKVARAMMSPSGIVLAGAGTALAILVGVPFVAAPIFGAVAWAARVAASVPRPAGGERIDPFTLAEPWRRFVMDAQSAATRFDRTVAATRPGPLRDRLETVGARIDDGVQACWRIARQGHNLVRAYRQLDVEEVRRELAHVDDELRRQRHPESTVAALERTKQALESQLGSAERLATVARDAENRLRVLNAQLDESVARAVELSVHGDTDASALSPLTTDVEHVVGEMEALRQAIEETHGTPGATATGTA